MADTAGTGLHEDALAVADPGAAVQRFPGGGGPKTLLDVIGNVAWFGVAALPVSMGVAILKYRLFEIDRIISRTLAYAIVTGLLVGVYAGLVLLATHLLDVRGPGSVAAATLVAAALFAPLRRRVQHLVDRPVQPGQVRRRAHGGGVRGRAAGHGGP